MTQSPRWIAALLAGAFLAAGASGARAESEQEKQLYEAAKKEGALTWYSGVLDQGLCEKVGQAFTAKYPGIRVDATKTTSQVAFQRLLQDIKSGEVQSDVLTSTDASHLVYLKEKGELVKFVPDNAKEVATAFQNIDPDGYYHVTWANLASIVYNTNKVKAEDAPKNWPDLLDPKWKDQVTVGSPSFSGMVGVWTLSLAKLYGWDYFTKLNAQKPQVGRSIDDAVTVLNSGERMVGLGAASTALRNAAKGNPIAVVYPTDGAVAVVAPSGLIKGSKSPNAGKLFLQFMLSFEYSKLLADNFEQSLRPDVPPAPGARPLSEVKVISPPVEEITKEMPGAKEKWKEVFGM
ncbi:MAG TPA: extracellular solute-binding protein [Stellaceae bacterium]|nr:extracellular solute-binding protein [Stellaceae bacterium]